MKYKSKPIEVEAVRASEVLKVINSPDEWLSLVPWLQNALMGKDKICLGFLTRDGQLLAVRNDGIQGGGPQDYVFWTETTGVMMANQKVFEEAYDLVH